MNYYSQDPLPEDARLSVSSVILLAIFVGAVVMIAYFAVTMPWSDDDGGSLAVLEENTAGDLGEVALEDPDENAIGDGGEVALQPSE